MNLPSVQPLCRFSGAVVNDFAVSQIQCANPPYPRQSRIAFCDPGVRWFTVPRFTVAYPEIQIKDELYEGTEAAKLLSDRVYDLIVTPEKVQSHSIESQPFLPDQVFLSVPIESKLAGLESVSLGDMPEQPLLYPQIGGHFLTQIETIITQNSLPITLVKNEYNITQHLIRTTNFLATISTLSRDLRYDGTHRALIPLNDPELNVMYYVSFLKTGREKAKSSLSGCFPAVVIYSKEKVTGTSSPSSSTEGG